MIGHRGVALVACHQYLYTDAEHGLSSHQCHPSPHNLTQWSQIHGRPGGAAR